MSDTSDYTVVTDSSSEAQVPAPLPPPSSHKVLGHAGDEIRELLPMIRNFSIALYEAHLQDARDDGLSEDGAKHRGYHCTTLLSNLLEYLGKILARFPEKGYTETADLMADILTEASSILAAGGEDGEMDAKEERLSLGAVLRYKCVALGQLRASQLEYETQARLLRGGKWEEIINNAIKLHSMSDRDAVRRVARDFCILIPKYLHSITAIYGSADGAWNVYVDYGIAVISKLDKGRKEAEEDGEDGEDSKKDEPKYEYTTTWWEPSRGRGCQMFLDIDDPNDSEDKGENAEKKDGKPNTAWNQARAWCSSFWR